MGEEILLIAEPRDSLRGAFFEAKPEEIDIYLGEFASKALQGLDELLAKKEIRLLEALDLKRKCQHLVNLTKKTQKNALQLEDMFVRLTEAGKRISSALRRRNEFPDGFESEADNLRKQILRAYNDVMAADHNVESLTYQIAALEEEMKPLAKEAAKFPTAEVRPLSLDEVSQSSPRNLLITYFLDPKIPSQRDGTRSRHRNDRTQKVLS